MDWRAQAGELLRQHREIVRLEWRDPSLKLGQLYESAYRSSVFERMGRETINAEIQLACNTAKGVNHTCVIHEITE